MNIKMKLRIIIPSILLVLGIILCIIGLSMGAVSDYKNKLELTEFEANISTTDILNLDIDVALSDISVISSNDVDEFYISARNITKDFLEYSTANNTLKLTYDTKKWYQTVLLPGYWNSKGLIEIYIPAKLHLKDVEINAEYGNSKINYLTAERVYINCGSEDNQIKNLNCDYTEINNKKGEVNAMNINSENVDLNFISGSSVFTNFVSNSVIINNKRNDMQISGIIKGDSSIQTESGDVKLTLYGEVSDYNFEIIDGDPSLNDDEIKSNKDGKYAFKLKGDINIYIK